MSADAFLPFPSRRSVVYARRGMVASSHPLAAQAGLRVLQEGGNAADAAIATAAMLAVVEPMSTGVGGDCFALYWEAAARQVSALNGSGRAPAAAEAATLRAQGHTSMPEAGPHSITVPGTVAGWADLLAHHGTMPLAALLAPAIAAAEEGHPVAPVNARVWEGSRPRLDLSAGGAELLLDGRAPRAGEVIRLPTLARTLRAVAEGGPDAFYRGPLARQMAAFVQARGGWLAADDLAAHRSTWDVPLHTDYRGVTVYECPPNGQGLAALLALNIAAGFDLRGPGFGAPDRWHLLIEAARLAMADAHRYIADPAFARVPVAGLLAPAYARERRGLIAAERALAAVPWGTPPRLGDDTTYLVTADGQGNACSFINSLCYGFGSGLVVPGTGICLQNRASGFVLEDGHPNALAPGRRPYHTLIPGMTARDGELCFAFGFAGGLMQPQAHLQLLVNLLDHDLNVQQALDAPRFRVQDGEVLIEEGLGAGLYDELARRGHRLSVRAGWQRGSLGVGQAVAWDAPHRVWAGGSEPRKDGFALGF